MVKYLSTRTIDYSFRQFRFKPHSPSATGNWWKVLPRQVFRLPKKHPGVWNGEPWNCRKLAFMFPNVSKQEKEQSCEQWCWCPHGGVRDRLPVWYREQHLWLLHLRGGRGRGRGHRLLCSLSSHVWGSWKLQRLYITHKSTITLGSWCSPLQQTLPFFSLSEQVTNFKPCKKAEFLQTSDFTDYVTIAGSEVQETGQVSQLVRSDYLTNCHIKWRKFGNFSRPAQAILFLQDQVWWKLKGISLASTVHSDAVTPSRFSF